VNTMPKSCLVPLLATLCAMSSFAQQAAVDKGSPLQVTSERELVADAHVVIDVGARSASQEYRFSNASSADLALELAQQKGQPASQLMVGKNGSGTHRGSLSVEEQQMSAATRRILVTPRVRASRGGAAPGILIAHWNFDFEVRLPEGARLVRSTIPFTAATPRSLQWKGSGITVMPPIEVLYTTAVERVALRKQVIPPTSPGLPTLVKIEIQNQGTAKIRRLDLRAQFPRGAFEPVEASLGTFQTIDQQIVRWEATVPDLEPAETRVIELQLFRPGNQRPVNFVVRAYNEARDLVAMSNSSGLPD